MHEIYRACNENRPPFSILAQGTNKTFSKGTIGMRKTLVLISGKLRSGKDTFADYLEEAAKEAQVSTKRGLFARALKDNCRKDFAPLCRFLKAEYLRLAEHGIPHEEIAWMDVRDDHFYDNKTDMTRFLLQAYGTEIFRNRVDENYWVNQLLQEFSHADAEVFIVTDTRFPNEIVVPTEWAEGRSMLLSTVRIERESIARTGTLTHAHLSETALDEFPFWDYVYHNNGTKEDLREAASKFLKGLVANSSKRIEV